MTRFATFNVLSGRSVEDGRVDGDRFAAAVAALDADVLVMQEVDRDQPRSGGLDLTEIAAEAMGAEHRVFAPALYGTPGRSWSRARDGDDRPGPAYGCSLVSRLPLRDVEVVRMPAAPVVVPLFVPGHGMVVAREEPRVAVVARVDVGAGVTVLGTHLPFVPGWNRAQLRRVVKAVEQRPDPLVFMGDLNLRGNTPASITGFTPLVDAPTFPVGKPRWQLDHVLLRGPVAGLGTVTEVGTRALPVSDHRAVVVDVEF
ncbi:endonuclease/exonuclease/phosphatase family protein [Jatrophihabitans sp. YIM 134969]